MLPDGSLEMIFRTAGLEEIEQGLMGQGKSISEKVNHAHCWIFRVGGGIGIDI